MLGEEGVRQWQLRVDEVLRKWKMEAADGRRV